VAAGEQSSSARRAVALLPALCCCTALVCTPGAARAQATETGASAEPAERRDGWQVVFAPGGDLYPRYVADPRKPDFRIVQTYVSESTIPDAGESRYGLRLGGRYGFFRFHRADAADRGFQIDLEAGFLGQFDRDNSTDNIGWDGLYGVQLAWAGAHGVALRLALFHDSSHVGDEYAERTGRRRLNYTRQEYLAGVSWVCGGGWRTYAEAGYGYDLRNERVMQPWRLQYGLEYERPTRLGRGAADWYAAADLSTYEENDWDKNVTLQTGLAVRRSALGRVYRFGVEYYDGRSQIGEFFLHRERHLAIGVWFDL
jgi:hypothetical protein